MRHIGSDERRARLATRHRLAPAARTGDVTDIARSLVVLHATDPATVFLSVAARSGTATPADVERALYDDRSLLRMLAMRRTMFVAPTELVPVLQSAVATGLAEKQRRTYGRFLEQEGVVEDVDTWWREVERDTHKILLEKGEATGAQLSAAEPRLRTKVNPSPGKSYSKPVGITTWVLVTLGCEGLIVRGRPNGTWISSQYKWAPIEAWLPDGVPEVPFDEARAELLRQWLGAFGPAPVTDLKWWTGWSLSDVRKALTLVDTAEVALDGGGTGLVLSDDLDPVGSPAPHAALLPALDPTPMGWQERSWYLGDHAPRLFDRNGNIGPTIWWNGRIVGGWAQRPDGEVATRLLEDVGAEAETAIKTEAARMETWMNEVRAIPRFRTPLERELTA